MPKPLELTGRRFGHLDVLSRAGLNKHRRTTWLCRCVCGKEWIVEGISLTNGDTNSCGCMRAKRAGEAFTTHGLSKRPEYKIWTYIKTRCLNPRATKYPRYGGRGIRVCDRWAGSFVAFLDDVGPRPTTKHEIERIDNDGHYEPGNCRWATRLEQMANTSQSKPITWNGVTRSLNEWARVTRVDRATIRRRMAKGLPLDEVFQASPQRWNRWGHR